MTYRALETAAAQRHLSILGGFHATPGDALPDGCRTVLLLGPDEPRFWPAFTQSPEYRDGQRDPMDRWSTRVINAWAATLGATALYPFGGPPYHPFYTWALRTGRIHSAPVQFLVHDRAGMFVSFRGALALRDWTCLPAAAASPCDSCADQPCATACPVSALTPAGYDVPACKSYLGTADGQTCHSQGCAVRRICPVSERYGRLPAQSAYHMQQFKGDTP